MKIGILGSGPLGISLAINFSKHQKIESVKIYSRNQNTLNEMNEGKTSLFSEIELSKKIIASNVLSEVVLDSEILFITVDSKGFSELIFELRKIGQNIDFENKFFIICTKGIEKSGEFFHEIAIRELNTRNVALFLGPSFACEIAMGYETTINLVYHDIEHAKKIAISLTDENTNIKMVVITDYIGAQICSVMKNIAAIYLGIAKGTGATNDQLAVMFTAFVREIKTAINFYRGEEDTIFELCGIGDLFLTCTSLESRNYNFGYQLGKSGNVEAAFLICNKYYPEGYYGLRNLHEMNIKNDLKLEICEKLYESIFVETFAGISFYTEKRVCA